VWGRASDEQDHLLMERMEAIGRSLSTRGTRLCLLGLVRFGIDRTGWTTIPTWTSLRVAEVGSKQRYIEDLDWLRSVILFP